MVDFRQHLEGQLKEEFELLQEVEETLRNEDDPRLKRRWESAIKEIKQRIIEYQAELECPSVSPPQDNPNNRKIERLQRDCDLAQRQSDELTELINLITSEINENRGDTVRESNLRKKEKRYKEERLRYDQEIEILQSEIDLLVRQNNPYLKL